MDSTLNSIVDLVEYIEATVFCLEKYVKLRDKHFS